MLRPQPKWVVVGGCCLAFLSAAVNAVFLVQLGTSVSHLTGDVSRVGVDIARNHYAMSSALYALIVASFGFLVGAAAAGYFIHHPSLKLARPYGRSIIAIGSCLLVAHFALDPVPMFAIFLASFGCGLQNALATHYRGMILRTTHVTGLMTDLGSTVGMILKGHRIALWKVGIPAILILSFFVGSGFGAILHLRWPAGALLVLAGAYIIGGIGWTIYKHLIADHFTDTDSESEDETDVSEPPRRRGVTGN